MTSRKAVAAGAVAALAVLLVPAPARAAPAPCTRPRTDVTAVKSDAVPYEDQVYDVGRIASLATGAGVRVAVLDSGVDAGTPQLRGQVADGRDPLRGDSGGRQDCAGHGTAVASVIAAKPVNGVGFRGLAPGATIVPVRVSENEPNAQGDDQGDPGSADILAEGIRWAAGPGDAQVINLSLTTIEDSTVVREAVADAIEDGVVVVAAAGNSGNKTNPVTYPASYPGVIAVGAVERGGTRADFSQHRDFVDLAAIGRDVTVAKPGSGHGLRSGTSFAAPLVSATAALLLERFPGLTPDELTRRLLATTDPAPGGRRSDDYGYGLLNPYRALTETLGPAAQPTLAPAVVHSEDPAAAALESRRDRSADRAMIIAAVGGGLVVLVGVVAAILRRGRRRGWRPADLSPVSEEMP